MDQDTTAMKVIAVLRTDPKRRGHHTPWGTAWGRTGVVRSRERGGETRQEPALWLAFERHIYGRAVYYL